MSNERTDKEKERWWWRDVDRYGLLNSHRDKWETGWNTREEAAYSGILQTRMALSEVVGALKEARAKTKQGAERTSILLSVERALEIGESALG